MINFSEFIEKQINESDRDRFNDYPNKSLIILVKSGINSDGFVIKFINNGNIESSEYSYGYNASHSKELAKLAKRDYDNSIKYNWDRKCQLQPFATDIIDEYISKKSPKHIYVEPEKNVFKGTNVDDRSVKQFIEKYMRGIKIENI